MHALRGTAVATLLLLAPGFAGADKLLRIPVVTQVQGAVFYRTSVTIGNATSGHPTAIVLKLTYRSPVDGSLQNATLNAGQLLGYRALFYEDIIQAFKDAGVIRAADVNSPIFGSLLVTFDADNQALSESIAEARTYSPDTNGGTNGIAYNGRDNLTAGSEVIKAAVRNGEFGLDGRTRTNIGFVNESGITTDVNVQYRDAATGVVLREFTLLDLRGGEVVQLNDIFRHSSVPPGTRIIIVRAQAESDNARISGYAVQLDSETNDGAFFLFVEEEEICQYTPPT
jgi:hypothetical protein